jgi:hypothetical protein
MLMGVLGLAVGIPQSSYEHGIYQTFTNRLTVNHRPAILRNMQKTLRTILSTVALGGAVIGSFLLAANIGMAVAAYVTFLASSVAGVWLLIKTPGRPWALLWQNVFFIGVNIFGLVRHGISG